MSCKDVTGTNPELSQFPAGVDSATDEDLCVELTDDSGNGRQRSLE